MEQGLENEAMDSKLQMWLNEEADTGSWPVGLVKWSRVMVGPRLELGK
jgi:hypothetical protein